MIDTSKIKPGDTGTIRVMFDRLEGGIVFIALGDYSVDLPVSVIASHTPASWVPEKGDVVAWSRTTGEWTIRAVDGDQAWIRSGDGVAKLSDLTLIRKEAA